MYRNVNLVGDKMDIFPILQEFARNIAIENIEIYNEASIQYELAIFLRKTIGGTYKIQLERNISYFGLNKSHVLKKEMDIVIFKQNKEEIHCIELKYPRQGQYPEQMFSACKDVKFLEQLVNSGFNTSYFMMFADDPLFYIEKGDSGIYRMFRKEKVIKNNIRKPTGRKDQVLSIDGVYNIYWTRITDKLKYFIIKVEE